MPPLLATFVCLAGIAGLFLLDRDRRAPASWALVVPFVWLCISTSRTVSQWLGNVNVDSADQLVEGSRIDALIFAALIALALLILAGRKRRVVSVTGGILPLLLFLAYCGVSSAWSDYPVVALKRWIKAAGDVAMVLVVVTDPAANAVKRVFGRAGFLLVPLSILTIRYYPALGRAYSAWTGEAFNIGVSTGKNGLGYLCLICGLASFWCFVEAFRSQRQSRVLGTLLAHGTLLLLVLYLFRITHSATSFGCFLIGCALITLGGMRSLTRTPLWIHAIVFLLVLGVVYVVVLDPGVGLLEAVGRDSTLTGRTRLWAQLLRVPVNPLVGAGYESFWLGSRLKSIWEENWEHPNQAHNGYLELYLDLGWIGLALAGAFMFSAYRQIVDGLRRNHDVARLALAYFVTAVIYNLTEHAFRELHPVWIALLLSATMVRALRPCATAMPQALAFPGLRSSARQDHRLADRNTRLIPMTTNFSQKPQRLADELTRADHSEICTAAAAHQQRTIEW